MSGILLLAVVVGFGLGRVPSGDISSRRIKQWWTNRRFARMSARCARGDHVDLTEPDDKGVRWCGWCESVVHPNGNTFTGDRT